MPSACPTRFDELAQAFASGDGASALDRLTEQLAAEGRYHDLYDALLIAARRRLGLSSLDRAALDALPEPTRSQMEEASLSACRRVGSLLLAEGKLGEAWMYLRPAGEQQAMIAALGKAEPTEENVDELIQIALHDQVAPGLGFGWVLENYGVCNAITAIETIVVNLPRAAQVACAERLVRQLHGDLWANLRSDAAARSAAEPTETNIVDLLAAYPELVAGGNYHIDTTHLASVVRWARLSTDVETNRLAYELAKYGGSLASHLQDSDKEPFEEGYVGYALFFGAAMGRDVKAAIDYFRRKAESLPVAQYGSPPAETFVALLDRTGRTAEALAEHLRLIPADAAPAGLAPTAVELAIRSGATDRLMSAYRQRGDLLRFAAALADGKRLP